MPFYLSPGVYVTEIDLTTIVPAVGTTEGAFAGSFKWGPVDTIVTLGTQDEIVSTFGRPDANTFKSFYSAANFLDYARTLRIVRSANTVLSRNAVSGSFPVYIKNRDSYELDYQNGQAPANSGIWAARYPGDLGNSLQVSLWCSPNTVAYQSWEYADDFNGPPGTSVYVGNVNGANDEMHMIVIDEDGRFTGVSGTILEKFSYISKAIDATNDDGSSNYYVNVINDRSRYVYVINQPVDNNVNWGNTASGRTFTSDNTSFTKSLAGGVDAYANTGYLMQSYDKFKNAEEVDISLIITGDAPQVVSEYVIENLAEFRKDCVAFISPDFDDVVNNAGNEVTDCIDKRNMYNSTSYAVMDCNWKYQFDKYNNVYRWVPLNGDIAGLCVRTDYERDPWYSPAGFNRGHIKNVVKLAWNPTFSQRDDLYKNGINPVCTFPGEGVVLYGDKTMLAKPSAFDRINVRRLFIVLEKAISRAAKYSLFEFNDEFTRAQFVALVEPFLRDVQGRRGIYDFRVVCDTSNNTPEVIDRNEFIGDIYIKPARSINFIQLNFIAVRTGVAFEEVVGKWG
jgi:phage tail sheath protein FI